MPRTKAVPALDILKNSDSAVRLDQCMIIRRGVKPNTVDLRKTSRYVALTVISAKAEIHFMYLKTKTNRFPPSRE